MNDAAEWAFNTVHPFIVHVQAIVDRSQVSAIIYHNQLWQFTMPDYDLSWLRGKVYYLKHLHATR